VDVQVVEIDAEPAGLVLLVTGAPAAGTTTVCKLLAERLRSYRSTLRSGPLELIVLASSRDTILQRDI